MGSWSCWCVAAAVAVPACSSHGWWARHYAREPVACPRRHQRLTERASAAADWCRCPSHLGTSASGGNSTIDWSVPVRWSSRWWPARFVWSPYSLSVGCSASCRRMLIRPKNGVVRNAVILWKRFGRQIWCDLPHSLQQMAWKMSGVRLTKHRVRFRERFLRWLTPSVGLCLAVCAHRQMLRIRKSARKRDILAKLNSNQLWIGRKYFYVDCMTIQEPKIDKFCANNMHAERNIQLCVIVKYKQ